MSRTARLAWNAAAASLVALIFLCLAWELWLAPIRPGGSLLASGIFEDREADVVTAFEAAGLAIAARSSEGEWVALEARRPA